MNQSVNLKGFPEIYATAGKNVDANVFINFSRFPLGLASLVQNLISKAKSGPPRILPAGPEWI